MTCLPNKIRILGAAMTLLSGLGATPALATENGNSSYLPGSSQFYGAAIPPFPGLYFLSQSDYYTANRLNDGHGNKNGTQADISSLSETMRFLYVSDLHVLGADVWGQFVLPMVHVSSKVSSHGFSVLDSSANALADITFTTALAWHEGPHTFIVGLDVAAPTGSYDSTRSLNVGLNHWAIMPTLGYKYFNPEGLELSLVPRFIFNTENSATDYTSGKELEMDYAIGQHFGPVRLGAVGYLYQQITKDSGPSVAADGNKAAGFAMGPSIGYEFSPAFKIDGSWEHEFYTANKSQGEYLWLNIATKF
jgi:hypothetical protein